MTRTLSEDATAEDMAALLEDIESKFKEKTAFLLEKEELK